MKIPALPAVLACSFLVLNPLAIRPAKGEGTVRVQGVGILTRVMASAAPQLRGMGIEIKIGEECGSTQAVAAMGAGEIDIALLGRALTVEEQAAYPDKHFHELQIGAHVVAVIVSRTIWESGVRALTREQVAALYEGKAPSWKQFGGEDRTPKFFEVAHGRGVWEIFATWLYGDFRKAPAVSWEVVANGAEAQNAVQFRSGAVSVAALRWADRREVFPLAIIQDAAEVVEPTAANVAAGKYPLARPVFLVLGDKPMGARRKVLEFFGSEKGQAILAENDLLPAPKLPSP